MYVYVCIISACTHNYMYHRYFDLNEQWNIHQMPCFVGPQLLHQLHRLGHVPTLRWENPKTWLKRTDISTVHRGLKI